MNKLDRLVDKYLPTSGKKFGLFFAILTLLSLLVIISYGPAYKGDDFYFHFRRFNALIDALRDGTFPAYIDYKSFNGYGYLSNVFYSDIILIPFALLSYFTGAYPSYIAILFVFNILCGVFTYHTVNIIYKNRYMAAIASLLYTFCSYRLLDCYPRAALGEYLSFTFLPLLFLGCYHIIKGDYKKWYILTIGYSLLIYSHLLSSVIAFILILLALIIFHKSFVKEPRRIAYLLLATVTTIIITSYSIFPIWEQMRDNTLNFQAHRWILPMDNRLNFETVLWGLIAAIPNSSSNGYTLVPKIGLLLTLGIAIRLFIKQRSKTLLNTDLMAIVGIILVLLSLEIAPWGRFPLYQFSVIQFPWRLYEFASYFLAMAGAYYLSKVIKSRKAGFIAASVICIYLTITIVCEGNYYKEKMRPYRTALEKPTMENNFLGGGLEYVPAKLIRCEVPYERGDSVKIQQSETLVGNIKREGRVTSFDINTTTDSLEIPLLYYKGYKATLNNKELPVRGSSYGLVEIPVDESGRVEVYYAGTTVQRVSFYITLTSIVLLCIYIPLQRRKQSNNKNKKCLTD